MTSNSEDCSDGDDDEENEVIKKDKYVQWMNEVVGVEYFSPLCRVNPRLLPLPFTQFLVKFDVNFSSLS